MKHNNNNLYLIIILETSIIISFNIIIFKFLQTWNYLYSVIQLIKVFKLIYIKNE